MSCQGTPTVPLPVPYWRLHCLPTHGSHRAHGGTSLWTRHFLQNGDCWASTKWLPNAGAVSSLQKSIMKCHDLMNPKLVSLQKFAGILTCPKKSQQHVPTKVNWCYLLVCKMVYLQKLGVWGTFSLQNRAPTAFCIGLKASMFVVEIGTGIFIIVYSVI